jgi:lipopolysaccharide/colanic/teichoic acid biosynthesis glycosyltransferase
LKYTIPKQRRSARSDASVFYIMNGNQAPVNTRDNGDNGHPNTHNRRQRLVLMDELYRRYGRRSGLNLLSRHAQYWRKKYAWLIVVGTARLMKRLADIGAAAAGLIALSPMFLCVAAAIKITDRGPVFFWQTRVGKWGREFPFPKFRSMVVDAETLKTALLEKSDHENSVTFKMKKDPRITWIGRIIRKLSIDELPQLWCVLKGDMSLVGPRPAVPREVEQYTLADRRRLDVTPGLTSLWAISGRGDIPFDRQVELDVEYIESQSLWNDTKILVKTVPAVLLGKGAY